MKDEDFKGIMAGLKDAIAFVKGDSSKGRVVAGPDIKPVLSTSKERSAPRPS